jgi:hypothetical protein
MSSTQILWIEDLYSAVTRAVVLLLLSFTVSAADISVISDRNPVSMDESFNLVFSTTDEVDNDPDFTPLEKDFEILGTQKTSQFSFINGKTSRENIWYVTLLAKHAGDITIPPIAFGSDRSHSISLKVKESGVDSEKGREIFLEIETSADEVYVQQELGVVIRLYRSVATANADLSELTVSGVNSLVERLAEGAQYHTRIDNKTYQVFERRYVVFPQESGDLTINQVVFKATKGGFANPFGGQPKSIIRRSEEKSVRVKAVPASWQFDVWLPAQSLEIAEIWAEDPPLFRVGEPVTRTVTLTARGLLASQLPEINMDLPSAMKFYPDQPVLKNQSSDRDVVGTRVEAVALIPSQAGKFNLPEIRIPYWSVRDETTRYAVIPERTVEVLPAMPAGESPPVNDEQATLSAGTATERPVADQLVASAADVNTSNAVFWQLLSALLFIAWLVTLYFLWRICKGGTRSAGVVTSVRSGQSLRAVRDACMNNDAPACKQALLNWAAGYWTESTPRSMGAIASRLGIEMKPHFDALNNALYNNVQAAWDGQAFWQALTASIKHQESSPASVSGHLEPIFRIN